MEGEVVYPFHGCCCTSDYWIAFKFRCTDGTWEMDDTDSRYWCPYHCYFSYSS